MKRLRVGGLRRERSVHRDGRGLNILGMRGHTGRKDFIMSAFRIERLRRPNPNEMGELKSKQRCGMTEARKKIEKYVLVRIDILWSPTYNTGSDCGSRGIPGSPLIRGSRNGGTERNR